MRKRRLLLAGYGVFAAILFVTFVTASFPYADTISALVAPMRMKVVFQRQEMNFPIGARLENVRLISIPNERSLLQSPDITVSPGVAWFFLGRPSIRIRAQIYGGVIDAAVGQRARATIVNFELDSLDLKHVSREAGQLKLPASADGDEEGDAPHQLGVFLSGELSGSGSAQFMGPDIIGGSASMILLGRDVKVETANGLPPLELGTIRGKVLLAQGVAIFQSVRAYGPDGNLEANGKIQLAPDVANSTVELTLTLTPTAKGRASFGFLLNMLPHAPSEGPYHLEGSLTGPSLS
jgi:type II secretion system protein N